MRGWGCYRKRMPRASVCQAGDNGAALTVLSTPSAVCTTAMLLLLGIKKEMSISQAVFEDSLKLWRENQSLFNGKLSFSNGIRGVDEKQL